MKTALLITTSLLIGVAMVYFATWRNEGGVPGSRFGEAGLVIAGISLLLLVALPFIRLIEWLF